MLKKTVGLFFKSDKERVVRIARQIMEADYGDCAVRFLVYQDLSTDWAERFLPYDEQALEEMDVAIAIGGDGTFLRTARHVRGYRLPIYGINAGRLGFLTAGDPGHAVEDVRKILSGSYGLMRRMPIKGELRRDGQTVEQLYALNEITMTKGAIARPVDLLVTAGEETLYRFIADGLIVATPTGSTAYALSAGGPIVHPDVPCLLVVPVCPHSLYPRPLILGGSEVVCVKAVGESHCEVMLSGDGYLEIPLAPGDEIALSLDTEECVEMIKLGEGSYYELLRHKLNWGGNLESGALPEVGG